MDLSDAKNLTLHLIDYFDLQYDWQFKWDNAKRRLGSCQQKKTYLDEEHRDEGFEPLEVKYYITLSKPITKLNDYDTIEETIRHEIAHALDIETRGYSSHDEQWKEWARFTGAEPERVCNDDINMVPYNYFMYCPNCETNAGSYRKRRKVRFCRHCHDIVIMNIPADKLKQVEQGTLPWPELPQAKKTVSIIEKNYTKNLERNPVYREYHDYHNAC